MNVKRDMFVNKNFNEVIEKNEFRCLYHYTTARRQQHDVAYLVHIKKFFINIRRYDEMHFVLH